MGRTAKNSPEPAKAMTPVERLISEDHIPLKPVEKAQAKIAEVKEYVVGAAEVAVNSLKRWSQTGE